MSYLGSLEHKFQCRAVPLKARGLDLCAYYHSAIVFGTLWRGFHNFPRRQHQLAEGKFFEEADHYGPSTANSHGSWQDT